MMYLLAKDIHSLRPNEDAGAENSNVAIAIIDEPTFIGKSTTLLAFLRSRLASFHQPPPTPKLTFLLGTDTLERLFSPRYYPSEESMLTSLRYFFGESEGSTVVCARRDPRSYPGGGTQPTIPHLANEFLRSNQITLIDIGDEEQGYSSAQVRRGRQLQQQGGKAEGWKKFVSWRVGRYIEERGLYSESE
jgi:nicotinamide-nucleotide adenylyltransferase